MYRLPSTARLSRRIDKNALLSIAEKKEGVKKALRKVDSFSLEYVFSSTSGHLRGVEIEELYLIDICTSSDVDDSLITALDPGIKRSIQTFYRIENGPLSRYMTTVRSKGYSTGGKARYIKVGWVEECGMKNLPPLDSVDKLYLLLLQDMTEQPFFEGEGITEYAKRLDRICEVQKLIVTAQKRLSKELQPQGRIQLNSQLQSLERELEELTDERRYQYGKVAEDIAEYHG